MAYLYAVIEARGSYGSGMKIHALYRTNDRARAVLTAMKMTKEFRAEMKPFGGTSGGYRAIRWEKPGTFLGLGCDADRLPSVQLS